MEVGVYVGRIFGGCSYFMKSESGLMEFRNGFVELGRSFMDGKHQVCCLN